MPECAHIKSVKRSLSLASQLKATTVHIKGRYYLPFKTEYTSAQDGGHELGAPAYPRMAEILSGAPIPEARGVKAQLSIFI